MALHSHTREKGLGQRGRLGVLNFFPAARPRLRRGGGRGGIPLNHNPPSISVLVNDL